MELNKLAETVLLQLECFWVLQELDEGFRTGDQMVRTSLGTIYARRPISYESIHPLVRLNTTLSLLLVPLAFVSRLSAEELRSAGFEVREEFDVSCRQAGQECNLSTKEFLLVLRNAVAHLPDFASGAAADVNISFDEGILRCWTERRQQEVIFRTERGFVLFLNAFVQLARRSAGALLQLQ